MKFRSLILLWTILSTAGASDTTSAEVQAETPEQQQLWILNAEGDDVHVYEIGEPWTLLAHIKVGPNPHGISATADGRTVHIAIENEDEPHGELLWIDTGSFEILDRLDVGFEPNEIECTPDGSWIYVPCNDGYWWIVDGKSHEVVKKIWTGGQPHNTLIGPDHELMYLLPMGLKTKIEGEKVRIGPERAFVVDINAGHEMIGEIQFDSHPRPGEIDPQGRILYQNIDDLTGFQVADLSTQEVIATVEHEINEELDDRDTRCHGIQVRPDGRELWCCDVDRHRIHVHELESGDYEQTDTIALSGRVYWLMFTPDGAYAFASLRSEGQVAVINPQTHEVLAHLQAGHVPKRTQVITIR